MFVRVQPEGRDREIVVWVPNLDHASFDRTYSIVSFANNMKAKNSPVVFTSDIVHKAFEVVLKKALQHDAELLQFYRNQLRCPKDHKYWNPDAQVGEELANYYTTVHPRLPDLKALGRVAMKAANEEVFFAPYYGFTTLETIDVQHFIESIIEYNEHEGREMITEDKMRKLWHDLIYREFYFEDDDLKDEVYTRIDSDAVAAFWAPRYEKYIENFVSVIRRGPGVFRGPALLAIAAINPIEAVEAKCEEAIQKQEAFDKGFRR